MPKPLSFAALALASLAPVLAAAQDADTARARALNQEALELVHQAAATSDQAKYEAAREKFLAVYAMAHRPNALFNAALTERDLSRPAEAVHHFRQFVRLPGVDRAHIQEAKKNIDNLRSFIASVEVRAPAGAEVLVDSVVLEERAPLSDPVDLPPGKHTIAARFGDAAVVKEVDLVRGAATELELQPALPPPAPGPTPPPAPAPAGSPVPPAVLPTPDLPEMPTARSGSGRTVALALLGGATVAGTGIAVAYGIAAASSSQQENLSRGQAPYACFGQTSSTCADWHNTSQSRAQQTNLEIGFAVLGGAAAAGLVGTFLFWPRPSAASGGGGPEVHVAPLTLSAGVGGSISGRF